jgi:hypothetical protein
VNRRSFLLWVALVVILMPLLVGFGPVRQESPITLSLEAGYGRHFRADQWLPLLLTVANDGPDVSGALRVRAENNVGLNGTTYSTPLDLPQQSRKQVFLYVSVQNYARQIQVELVNEAGAVLQTVESQLLPTSEADILTVVVTDSPGGSVDLSGIALGTGSSYQANWSVENIPPQADALRGLDVMVFSDVDTGRMSLEQQQAVADWVLAGGHLIVSGGPNYRLTTAALADLLPVEISGTRTVDDLTALADFAGQYGDTLAEPDVVIATGAVQTGASVLVGTADSPLLARWRYGAGLVDYMAADPGLAPFRRWRDAESLWEALVVTTHQMPGWSNGIQDWTAADRVVREAPGFALPSALQMLGMLALYITVIGPLNYIVLRLIGRREWAWFTVPVLVVVFSILAYFTGFSLRGTQATLNRLAVVQVWPDAPRAQVDGLIGILSPRRATYQLVAPEGLTLRPLPEEATTGAGGFNPVSLATRIEQTSIYTARELLVDASLIAGFATSGFIDDAPRLDGAATITYDATGAARIAGDITNATGFELEDAVVLVSGGFEALGTLAPGDRAAFDVPFTGNQSAPLTLVSGRDSGFYFDAMDLTTQDLMGADFDPTPYYIRSPSLAERLNRQRQNFVQAIASDTDITGGRGDRVFVVGWAKASPLAMDLQGTAWTSEDMALYIFELPVTINRTDETVRIPPQYATWFATDATTIPGVRPYNLTINGGEQASFRFVPLPSARLETVTQIDILARRSSPSTATVYVWNWATDTWDALDLQSGMRARVADPAPYLGPGNAVEVLLVPDNINTYVSYAQIDVTWRGTF